MSRKLLFNLHFYLSSFFTPFLFLMAITGTSYLFGFKGSAERTTLVTSVEIAKDQREALVRDILTEIVPDYRFEYIKESGDSFMTRPTTRTYYHFIANDDGTFKIQEVKPDFLLRIIEVHKGHGPGLLKWLEKMLGVSLFLIVLSGLLMSLQIKARVKSFIAISSLGAVLLVGLFLL